MDNPGSVIARLEAIEQDLALRQKIVVEDRGYKTPCWVWVKSRMTIGYGDGWFDGKHLTAHQYAYVRLHGAPPPSPLELDHLCRVRLCCNPTHLEAVTHEENCRRGAKAKLTREQIDEILASTQTYRALAKTYGVTHQTIAYYKGGAYQQRLERAAAA